MAMGRGRDAYQAAADAAKSRGGGGFSRVFKLRDGERCLARFRGFAKPPSGMSWDPKAGRLQPFPTLEELEVMNPMQLRRLCSALSVFSGIERGEKIGTVLGVRLHERLEQLEPAVFEQHYVHNNPTRMSYFTCASSWNPPGECVLCFLKDGGDRRISTRTTSNFSLIPRRMYHYEKAGQPAQRSNQRGGQRAAQGDFQYCSNHGYEADGRCTYCQRGVEAKHEGMHRFPLAPMYVPQLLECADRIAGRCVACAGIGKIRSVGWECASCGELLGDRPDARPVTCGECSHHGPPKEIVECDRGCADARRGQLFDTDVLITRIGDKKQTTYSFVEQFPFEPLPDELMKLRLPQYESVLKPLSIDAQCRGMALTTNPFNGAAVAAAQERGQAQTESYDDPGALDAQDVTY